ncbi:MAG: DNA/RNA nuclease SfsA [Clostridium sp.]
MKHLQELTKAAKEGYHCSIAFVIQMNGIHCVLPNEGAQPEFKEALVLSCQSRCPNCLLQLPRQRRQHKNHGRSGRYFEIRKYVGPVILLCLRNLGGVDMGKDKKPDKNRRSEAQESII